MCDKDVAGKTGINNLRVGEMAAKMAPFVAAVLIGAGDGRMFVFLLVLGALTSAAGLSLVASGLAQEGVSAVTPGIIAAVGGLVLIGLGVLVRGLQRIEKALAARPMPRATRPSASTEAPVAIPPPERPTAQARIPFPPRPKPGAIGPSPTEDGSVPRPRERFPRLEPAPVAEEGDLSALLPRTVARAEDDVGEVKNVAAGGGGSAARLAARLNANPRPAAVPPAPRERPRGSVFDAFWPKGQRGRPDAPMAAGAQPSLLAPEASSELLPDPQSTAGDAAAVTVLKSGTVEGMAYTLYSDGSIEAQLPQGMVRFGSITELRNHIENES
jgi:hypothetical protein